MNAGRRCSHCGRELAHLEGWVHDIGDLCHPDDPALPDCYHLVTVYHEPVGARKQAPMILLDLGDRRAQGGSR